MTYRVVIQGIGWNGNNATMVIPHVKAVHREMAIVVALTEHGATDGSVGLIQNVTVTEEV